MTLVLFHVRVVRKLLQPGSLGSFTEKMIASLIKVVFGMFYLDAAFVVYSFLGLFVKVGLF